MAFTLVELLVSVAVIAVLMLVLTQVLTGTQRLGAMPRPGRRSIGRPGRCLRRSLPVFHRPL
ncbi:type II secretion system protein [Verrucomicrobium spinosum]|uniref:type II secretion system protein n=1 Tax=Verrucomicrobium spinosum TaxID=2736 RepID=UPI003CCD7BB7